MAVTGVPTNRTSIDLPVDVSREIMQKTQEESAIMQLARQIALPGRGVAINVITGDPEAAWVGETASKPVSDPGLATKIMRAYKLAVIVPFSDEFRRDAAALYDAIVERLPRALAQKFDATVFGNGSAPGSDFDTFGRISPINELNSSLFNSLFASSYRYILTYSSFVISSICKYSLYVDILLRRWRFATKNITNRQKFTFFLQMRKAEITEIKLKSEHIFQ